MTTKEKSRPAVPAKEPTPTGERLPPDVELVNVDGKLRKVRVTKTPAGDRQLIYLD